MLNFFHTSEILFDDNIELGKFIPNGPLKPGQKSSKFCNCSIKHSKNVLPRDILKVSHNQNFIGRLI